MNTSNDMILLAGSAGANLAAHIASILEHPLGRSFVKPFPDGEINMRGLHYEPNLPRPFSRRTLAR